MAVPFRDDFFPQPDSWGLFPALVGRQVSLAHGVKSGKVGAICALAHRTRGCEYTKHAGAIRILMKNPGSKRMRHPDSARSDQCRH